MIVRRIKPLIFQMTYQFPQQNLTRLCYSTASNPRFSNLFVDDDEGGSAVYRLALKFQRPTTVQVLPELRNRVSFIGTVDLPLKVINNKTDDFGVHTMLKVKNPYDSNRSFRILLKMWDEIGEMCMKHVKRGDFIYVSGHLGSYSKANENGQLRLFYEVVVKELNFVAQHGQRSSSQNYKESKSKPDDVGEAGMERYESHLYLWQVFFTNPFEWWDNRKCKKNPRQPDFKHKDTGEALWLRSNDPPWIKKQLELLDSKSSGGLSGQVSSHHRVSEWVYDE